MSDGAKIPQHQVDRILGALEDVDADKGTPDVDAALVKKIVELEVEYQFIDDRDRVLRSIRSIVEEHLQHEESTEGENQSA